VLRRRAQAEFVELTDAPDNPFRLALERLCGGRSDERTLAFLDADA
jgi:hypothetical protein